MDRIEGTMGQRIKEARKSLGLTQQKFAERIRIKPNTIANYEIGRNDPVDSVLELICREYHVSRHWLQTGEGEMFEDAPETTEAKLEAIFEEYSLSEGDKVIVREFLRLSHEDRQAVLRYAEAVARGMVKTGIVSKETPEQRRERLHRELDRQLDEEEASSASSLGA